MAKVKIQGHASGTGILTVTAPNTSTDRTITLPDSTDTLIGAATTDALTTRINAAGGRKNLIINGNFDIWQRGTSFAVSANTKTYTADRWVAYDSTNTSTISRQSADNDGSQYACRVQRDSGQTGTATEEFEQAFETEDIAKYRGKNVTVSFYLKKGANYSATSDNLVMTLVTGTAAEATHLNTGFTGAVTNGTLTQAITSSSVKYSFTTTAVIASNVTQMALRFVKTPTGTAGADDWFQIEQVQLEAGSVATDFEYRSYGEELALCERYCQLVVQGIEAIGIGMAYSTGSVNCIVDLTCEMRTTPTLTQTSGTNYYSIEANGGRDDINDFSGGLHSRTWKRRLVIVAQTGVSQVAGHASQCEGYNANALITAEAEL